MNPDAFNVNPDAMHEDDLLELEQVALNLAEYAKWKRLAMKDRKAGAIRSALLAEERCEQIYARLPEGARW